MSGWIVPVIFLIFILIVLAKMIRIVPEKRALVIIRLGRIQEVKGAGVVWLVPVIDQAKMVNVDSQKFPIGPLDVISHDNVPSKVSGELQMRIADPKLALTQVDDYQAAARQLVETKIREHCGRLSISEMLNERLMIESKVFDDSRSSLRDWGMELELVEIRAIEVPDETRRMIERKAYEERLRRQGSTQGE